jgi:hypothetical protein
MAAVGGGEPEAARVRAEHYQALEAVVFSVFRGLAAGHATRWVVAAAATAVARLALGTEASAPDEGLLQQELAARLAAVEPVLHEQILAAVECRPPSVSGGARVLRNIAEHVGFGEGPSLLALPARELRKRQRGKRRGGTAGHLSLARAAGLPAEEASHLGGFGAGDEAAGHVVGSGVPWGLAASELTLEADGTTAGPGKTLDKSEAVTVQVQAQGFVCDILVPVQVLVPKRFDEVFVEPEQSEVPLGFGAVRVAGTGVKDDEKGEADAVCKETTANANAGLDGTGGVNKQDLKGSLVALKLVQEGLGTDGMDSRGGYDAAEIEHERMDAMRHGRVPRMSVEQQSQSRMNGL